MTYRDPQYLFGKISTSLTNSSSIKKTRRIFNTSYAQSKWPHLHRAYVIRSYIFFWPAVFHKHTRLQHMQKFYISIIFLSIYILSLEESTLHTKFFINLTVFIKRKIPFDVLYLDPHYHYKKIGFIKLGSSFGDCKSLHNTYETIFFRNNFF